MTQNRKLAIATLTTVILILYLWHQRSKPHQPLQCCIRLQEILYIDNVFQPRTFNRVQDECKALHPMLKNENGFAIGRQFVQVSEGSYLHTLFYDQVVMKRLGSLIGTQGAYGLPHRPWSIDCIRWSLACLGTEMW
jgi:hypothetical protein